MYLRCIYMQEITLPKPLVFEWDKGNKGKNWEKHKVTNDEAEEAFFDKSMFVFTDIKHSMREARYGLFGKTKRNRLLFIAFTVRKNKVRIISARPINRKEMIIYEKTT